MKRFLIISNEQRDENLTATKMIRDYILSKGGECSYYVSQKTEWGSRSLHELQTENLNAECILVLGGDGTLVRSARELAKTGIPVIGVNLGTIGYLCELDMDSVFAAIDQLKEDRYDVEHRMMVEGIVPESECGTRSALALNDIVIHRAGNSQLVNLEITVDGEYLATYSADGMILATPTGSTGYNLSAGGPIVDPKTDLLLITPINPHTISVRNIVVGADAEIEVTLTRRREEQDEEAEVSCDGDHFIQMKVGDRILVRKADVRAQIMRLNQLSFLQILRKKFT